MKPATFAPAYCAMYPMLVEIVRWHGYALAVHGTVQRDFDLVAIPWGIDPSPPDAVVRELVGRLDVRLIGSFEPKMHGRVACTLSVGFGECAIDLSFMPCVPVRDNLTRATPPRAEVDVDAVCKAVYPVWCATTPRESWSDMEFILRRALARATGGTDAT